MEPKTFPVVGTQANKNSGSATSQQALALFLHLAKGQETALLNLDIPKDINKTLHQWLSIQPKPEISKMPNNVQNWLVMKLNQNQSQKGLSTLTLSQWLPIITKMQIASNQPDVLRISWLIGSQSPASNVASGNANMVHALLKLLIPIQMQDKASVIIREQQGSNEKGHVETMRTQTESTSVSNKEPIKQIEEQPQSPTKHTDNTGNSALNFELTFDLDSLGQLIIDINLNEFNLTSVCRCQNTQLIEKIEQNWPQLETRLTKFGFNVENSIELSQPSTLEDDVANNKSGLINIKV